ncbi:alginate export family protein [Croceicoccus bisphenolivorans]|uniref:alginate export family protein n=1 Tax=Croceicoccus bisphenolivorans TaxID=1783232 RepID=UPI00082D1196|nr:alginate export family protein [Croceicoccus bisphenolivorans]
MRKQVLLLGVVSGAALACSGTAQAKAGDPVEVADGVTIDPIISGVLRYEGVDQDNAGLNADALTLGMEAGFEVKASGFSFLAEAEGTLAIIDDYNDTISGNNGYIGNEPYSIVADPENVELNRLQVGYAGKFGSLTVGRQTIALGNHRFVGHVGWRQNIQTFDAVRGVVKFGPAYVDATYSNSQRTIFGMDAGAKTAFDGDHVFVNAGAKVAGIDLTAFAYLLDYDLGEAAPSSQTYGAIASGKLPIKGPVSVSFVASYAKQGDYKGHTAPYSADYINGELGVGFKGLKLTGGYELLGSANGIGFSTPMATLHKFNGFADVFLNTPGAGLQDYYGTLAYAFTGVKALPGLNASLTYHKFESDVGGADYGEEWDATLGFKLGGYPFLVKYANYNADTVGTDTEKLWIQVSFAY